MKYERIAVRTQLPEHVNLSQEQNLVLFNLQLHVFGDLREYNQLSNVVVYNDAVNASIATHIEINSSLTDSEYSTVVEIVKWVFLRSFVPEHQCPVKLMQYSTDTTGIHFLYQTV